MDKVTSKTTVAFWRGSLMSRGRAKCYFIPTDEFLKALREKNAKIQSDLLRHKTKHEARSKRGSSKPVYCGTQRLGRFRFTARTASLWHTVKGRLRNLLRSGD